MAAMAAGDLNDVPMMLSLTGLFYSLGGSLGTAVSAAIYTNTFPNTLKDHLPAESKGDYYKIYMGGYTVQLTYPEGSPIRKAIKKAWAVSQRDGSIAATCVLIICVPAILLWNNYRVDRKQNRGTVL
ncbi:unnamed protein product [Ambrosiozyma monospora]|uniref:Unnamed protein product n=1 Tax=Ambrosiozyma monospora TaxID=43982 RepID=A0ACB5U9Z5_AMBMO|nr:unnamed protein product [Ambrosiozyma monospora]